MKQAISLLTFILLSFSAYCQVPVPVPESELKTEFHTSIFQANYLTYKTLTRFLEQSRELISFNVTAVKISAKDLYYDKSRPYTSERETKVMLHDKYWISRERKIELLDSTLDLSKKWRTAIIESDLLDELSGPINRGFTLYSEKNTIYAVSPSPKDNSPQSIYAFEFNQNKEILAKKRGRLTA